MEDAGFLRHFACTEKRHFLEHVLITMRIIAARRIRSSVRFIKLLLADPQGCCSTRVRSGPSLVEGRLFH